MLPDAQFLQADVILEHLSKMDSYRLADGPVNGILDVELLQGVVGRVQNGEDSDDTVVVDLVVSQVQGDELVMGEKEFGYHHGTVGFDLVQVKVEHLEVRALLKGLSKVLSSLGLNLVTLEVQAEKTRGPRDYVS